MPIQILPPILANQIAAGEVVERPSSVVKELVENSIDAGATQIDIEIQKGGEQQIRIRDNGSGICREELQLALTRHATSKVSTLDDLEHITSLGFRGEALASISSVSRLTLTSRTAAQSEAWQAYAEGQEMAVTVKPAAHPVGTTVDVRDLFFNTPARRRFLRSEKTEFSHVDELLRRFALSRFDIALSLKHNGKLLRQYRIAQGSQAELQRVSQACGQEFVQSAVYFENEHLGLSIRGWVAVQPLRGVGEIQYCYVNGRMIRDKLLMHAIRQAYSECWTDQSVLPAYVIYLSIDPSQIDVNVHPTKHEVRFHDARQVHDYLVQVLVQTFQAGQNGPIDQVEPVINRLVEDPAPQFLEGSNVAEEDKSSSSEKDASAADLVSLREQIARYQSQHTDYPVSPLRPRAAIHQYSSPDDQPDTENGHSSPVSRRYSVASGRSSAISVQGDSAQAIRAYEQLLTEPDSGDSPIEPVSRSFVPTHPLAGQEPSEWPFLQLIRQRYVFTSQQSSVYLVDLQGVQCQQWFEHFSLQFEDGMIGQPLLMPVRLSWPESLPESILESHAGWLMKCGLKLKRIQKQLVISQVPSMLRQRDIAAQVPAFLSLLQAFPDAVNKTDWDRLVQCWLMLPGLAPEQFTVSLAQQLWQWFISSNCPLENQTWIARWSFADCLKELSWSLPT